MTRANMKLTDMGTTGLIAWAAQAKGWRARKFRRMRISLILEQRNLALCPYKLSTAIKRATT